MIRVLYIISVVLLVSFMVLVYIKDTLMHSITSLAQA